MWKQTAQGNVSIRWYAIWNIIILLIPMTIWILTQFSVQPAGVHIHHFYLGLAYIGVAIIEFLVMIVGVTVQVSVKTATGTRRLTIIYHSFWMISLLIGLILLLTDWKDFTEFLNAITQGKMT